jgi:hypothetical protein
VGGEKLISFSVVFQIGVENVQGLPTKVHNASVEMRLAGLHLQLKKGST